MSRAPRRAVSRAPPGATLPCIPIAAPFGTCVPHRRGCAACGHLRGLPLLAQRSQTPRDVSAFRAPARACCLKLTGGYTPAESPRDSMDRPCKEQRSPSVSRQCRAGLTPTVNSGPQKIRRESPPGFPEALHARRERRGKLQAVRWIRGSASRPSPGSRQQPWRSARSVTHTG